MTYTENGKVITEIHIKSEFFVAGCFSLFYLFNSKRLRSYKHLYPEYPLRSGGITLRSLLVIFRGIVWTNFITHKNIK